MSTFMARRHISLFFFLRMLALLARTKRIVLPLFGSCRRSTFLGPNHRRSSSVAGMQHPAGRSAEFSTSPPTAQMKQNATATASTGTTTEKGAGGSVMTESKDSSSAAPGGSSMLMTFPELARACANHSWITQLNCDPEEAQHRPNRKSRKVSSGHYVPVRKNVPADLLFPPPKQLTPSFFNDAIETFLDTPFVNLRVVGATDASSAAIASCHQLGHVQNSAAGPHRLHEISCVSAFFFWRLRRRARIQIVGHSLRAVDLRTRDVLQ